MREASILILTGAGISAESGIDTFRSEGGIWSKIDYRDVATPAGFVRDPSRVHDFYNARRRGLTTVEPNAAHLALARLEREHGSPVTVVTQNIDDLHERAGSRNLVHMHGELKRAFCEACGTRREQPDDLSIAAACSECGTTGGMRPDVVWFGEMPYRMTEIEDALLSADLFVSIGTSGAVYPAAGLVAAAREAGIRTLELNLEPSEGSHLFDERRYGPATEVVPAFVEEVLRGRE
jgi:NAD-dependent deacetylase